jgi:uncharacterized protein with PIN domain
MMNFVFNNRKETIPADVAIYDMLRINRMILVKLLKNTGMGKEEILDYLKNPDEEVKELLFELDHGHKTKKSYCSECKELMFPVDVQRNPKKQYIKINYSCRICGTQYWKEYSMDESE